MDLLNLRDVHSLPLICRFFLSVVSILHISNCVSTLVFLFSFSFSMFSSFLCFYKRFYCFYNGLSITKELRIRLIVIVISKFYSAKTENREPDYHRR